MVDPKFRSKPQQSTAFKHVGQFIFNARVGRMRLRSVYSIETMGIIIAGFVPLFFMVASAQFDSAEMNWLVVPLQTPFAALSRLQPPPFGRCWLVITSCAADQKLEGIVDDLADAYQNLQVGDVEEACLSRTLTYWELCNNLKVHPVVAMFLPTGASSSYPPSPVVHDQKLRADIFTSYNSVHRPQLDPASFRRYIAPPSATAADIPGQVPPNMGRCLVHIDHCSLLPRLSGIGDEFEHAYAELGVGDSEAACLGRAKAHWELCGGDPFEQVNVTYTPTGATASYPDTLWVQRARAKMRGLYADSAAAGAVGAGAREGDAAAGAAAAAGWKQIHVYVGSSLYTGREHTDLDLPRAHAFEDQMIVGWMSECLQDFYVARLFGFKSHGYFIDLAAFDAVRYSNTVVLEQFYDWDGLCIEPLERNWWGLSHRRCTVVGAVVTTPPPLPAGAGDADGPDSASAAAAAAAAAQVLFDTRSGPGEDCPGCAGIVGPEVDSAKVKDAGFGRYLPTVDIRSLLQRFPPPRVIDYLSLDIEGAETGVLQTFPWDEHDVMVITIERPKAAARAILKARGFLRVRMLCEYDILYVHESFPGVSDLLERYGHPYCGFWCPVESDEA